MNRSIVALTIFVQTYKTLRFLVLCDCQLLQTVLVSAFRVPWYTLWIPSGLANPYGVLWNMFYAALAASYQMSIVSLVLIDSAVWTIIYRYTSRWYAYSYFAISSILFIAGPVDALPVWLLGLGEISIVFLVLAVLAKLPFGAPLYVWQYVLAGPISSSFTALSNSWRYFIMAGWFVLVVYRKAWKWHLT